MKASGLFRSKGATKDKAKSQKDIVEFDHRFSSRIVKSAPGVLPPHPDGITGEREVNILFKKTDFDIQETQGVREERLTTWRYVDIAAVAWDHQHSSVKLSNPTIETSAEAPKTYSVTIDTTGPLGLNLVSTSKSGPGQGKSAAVESVAGAAAAAAKGKMKTGHFITSVNGTDTTTGDFAATMDTLREASRPMTLTMQAVDAITKGDGDKDAYIIFGLENSTEVEQELSVRIKYAFSSAGRAGGPATTYMGIFAGAEKPKPFQRKRASLVQNPTDKLPSPQTMRRLSMQTTRERKAGIRRQLALQHIHEGRNVFEVRMAGGMPRAMVMDSRQASVVADADRPGQAQMVIPYDLVDSYEVQGDSARIGVKAADDGSISFHQFNTADPMHLVNTLEFFINQHRVSNGLEFIPGSTHGRTVQKVHTLTGTVDATDSVSAELKKTMANKVASELVPAGTKQRRGSIAGNKPPWWKDLVVMHGWMLKKGGMTKSWQRRFFILYNTSQVLRAICRPR
jgi:hypothetical protein